MDAAKILIIDDETSIRDMLRMSLEMAGYQVHEAGDAVQGHSAVIDNAPDLILLDWMMPGTSGVELARRLKNAELTRNIPIIMLTAKGEEDNKIQGLDVGADDYITKPFSPRELMSRIKAVLRRSGGKTAEEALSANNLKLDPSSHRVTINDEQLQIGPTEYKLLEFFLRHQDRVFTRGQLLDHVWGGNVYIEERTVDVHIRRLRKAISLEDHDQLIQTVRGAGYRFSHNS